MSRPYNGTDRMMRALFGVLDRLPASIPQRMPALREWWRERSGEAVAADHRPHLEEAIAWMCRAHDATPDDGISWGYSLNGAPLNRGEGWQPSYPETTGYIIPTLLTAAQHLGRPDLHERALRAARWECDVQLPDGGVRAGVMGQTDQPAVFNTGQVVLGWLAAYQESGEERFADSARRASRFLAAQVAEDGSWVRRNSPFAEGFLSLYNARTAWAMAEAGALLKDSVITDAAARHLRMVRALQHANGWLPECCINDPKHPLLHTLAYAVRGLLEGGRVLQDDALLQGARQASEAIAAQLRDGWLPGRFHADWRPAVRFTCLTGNAQIANNWLRLDEIDGTTRWTGPANVVARYLEGTQNRTSADGGLRGGIKGSRPVNGGYGPFQVLSWATKYFIDLLIRSERLAAGQPPSGLRHGVLA